MTNGVMKFGIAAKEHSAKKKEFKEYKKFKEYKDKPEIVSVFPMRDLTVERFAPSPMGSASDSSLNSWFCDCGLCDLAVN